MPTPMSFVQMDRVRDRFKNPTKAKFVLHTIARHIATNGDYPGYAYPGLETIAKTVGSWPKEVREWIAGMDWDHDNDFNALWISKGLGPSIRGCLYCITLERPGEGCPHGDRCLHGTPKGGMFCPHGHDDTKCFHEENPAQEPCICEIPPCWSQDGYDKPPHHRFAKTRPPNPEAEGAEKVASVRECSYDVCEATELTYKDGKREVRETLYWMRWKPEPEPEPTPEPEPEIKEQRQTEEEAAVHMAEEDGG